MLSQSIISDENMRPKQLNIAAVILLPLFCCFSVLMFSLLTVRTERNQDILPDVADVAIMDCFDRFVANELTAADQAAKSVPKQFWLPDDALKGSVPDPKKFGTANDPSTLQWLLDDAQTLLNGQDTLFSTDITLMPGSVATYYLDDSIFAITWKQVMDNTVYTISEIKISHPSQFRRHIQGGQIDKVDLSIPTKMSRDVNAVVGSAADHYLGRRAGIIVYDGIVRRVDLPKYVDVCYIDKQGNLLFSYAGEILDKESAQTFVDENNISFSMSFGPVIVDEGVRCEPADYTLGEVNDKYARAALCQMDDLHYLVVTANAEGVYWSHLTIHQFAQRVATFGCKKAYTLDGGNTGSIVMNGKLINRTTFGYERFQGDLIYFCTAIPNH